ncbi:MAG: GGDEF domain-containing protein, partial [Deltaproteobacteria bacterium]|nr:GGDEF domain-containing protein [Deltaproteobacteria bacterium]
PFSIALMDLDGFKAVNDRCGHIEGDRLLKELALLTQSQIRKVDLLARWGGDEFIVLVLSDLQEAKTVAERIRKSIEDSSFSDTSIQEDDPRKAVTTSIGITQYQKDDTLDRITHRADKALYTIKARGGNGILVAEN